MNTVFNIDNAQHRHMFFDGNQGMYRIDKLVLPQLDKLARKMKGFYWQPEEIDLTKDKRDYKMLDTVQEHIFNNTLMYQNMLDSVQGRGPALTLLPHCSLPEMEACINWWGAMEQTHSDSYNYLLRNVHADASKVFDEAIKNTNIIKRTVNTIQYYDDFLNESIKYRAGVSNISLFELKRKFLLMMVSINALEGVSFYQSFACSFSFAEAGLMQGNSNIITLIARDESIHLALTQTILKAWRDGKDDPDFKILFLQEQEHIKNIYENIVEQEREWAQYLFSKGSLLGLNEQILVDYVEYIAGSRLKNLGIQHNYSNKNPLSWTLKYLNSSDKQESPQESEKNSYIIGGIKNDMEESNFSKYKT